MKTFLLIAALTLQLAFSATAQKYISLGTSANDGTGDKMRAAGIKINTNTWELFNAVTNLQGASNGMTTRITALEVGGGGGGDVTTAQFLIVSNQVQTVSNAANAFTLTASNGLFTVETTRNAAVSNAIAPTAFAAQGGRAVLTNLSAFYTNTLFLNGASNIVVGLSNVANNSKVYIASANYQVTANIILSNSSANPLAAINIFNKTNVDIEGVGWPVIFATNVGDMFLITNCDNVKISGFIIKGWVQTNNLIGTPAVVWGSLGLHHCQNIEISGNVFRNGHDHGVYGLGGLNGSYRSSTNNIRIKNNSFYNFGGYRSDSPALSDGTAVIPDGPWDISHNYFEDNLRGVEPYSENVVGPNLTFGGRITYNTFRNTLDAAIVTAGSTNTPNQLIAHNLFQNDLGYTRRGTNYYPAVTAINWVSSHAPKIKDNEIRGNWSYGIHIGAVNDAVIEDNRLFNIATASGAVSFPIVVEGTAYDAMIRGNIVRESRSQGIYLYGLRDSFVIGNLVENSVAEVGIQFATFGGLVTSNVLVKDNISLGNTNAYWDQALSGTKALTFTGNKAIGHTGNMLNLGATAAADQIYYGQEISPGVWVNDGTNIVRNLTIPSLATSNTFAIATPVASQVLTLHSTSAGQNVWTNLNTLTAGLLPSTWNSTNATTGAFTNTVNFRAPFARVGTTNSTLYLTNFTGNIASQFSQCAIMLHVGGGTVNKTVTWNNGAQHGMLWLTNANSPLWTTLTNDKTYVLSYSQVDTNVVTTIVLVE